MADNRYVEHRPVDVVATTEAEDDAGVLGTVQYMRVVLKDSEWDKLRQIVREEIERGRDA